MKGLVITTDMKIRKADFAEPAYKSIGKAVGGYIEIVHPKYLDSPYCMVVNEEGLLRRLPINLFGSFLYDTITHGSPIVGDIVILKEGFVNGERDFVGLSDDELTEFGEKVIRYTDGDYSWVLED